MKQSFDFYKSISPYLLSQVRCMDTEFLPESKGVYFVFKGTEIVYVGMSSSIRKRIAAHRGRDGFDPSMTATFIEMNEEDFQLINDTENYFIGKLCPKYNFRSTWNDELFYTERTYLRQKELRDDEFYLWCQRNKERLLKQMDGEIDQVLQKAARKTWKHTNK